MQRNSTIESDEEILSDEVDGVEPIPSQRFTPRSSKSGDLSLHGDEEEELDSSSSEDSEEEEDLREQRETADEKRLRLAEEFLARYKPKKRDESDSDSEAEGKELHSQLLMLSGRKKYKLGGRLLGSNQQPRIADPSTVRLTRGHALSPTCLALHPDGVVALTGAKDCSIIRWDVETGRRVFTYRGSREGAFDSEGMPLGHKGPVYSVAISDDGKYFASGGSDGFVHVWDPRSDKLIQSFKGHRDTVSALTFRRDSHELYSGSFDRTIKVWSVDDLAYIETLYGHQSEVQGIDSLHAERAVTCGADRSVRIWKIVENSQLIYHAHDASIDCVAFLDDQTFVTGSQDGGIAIFSSEKKKPLRTFPAAHAHRLNGLQLNQTDPQHEDDVYGSASFDFSTVPPWISSIAAVRNSDLIASGSCDGYVRLWSYKPANHKLSPVYSVPVPGFINGLSFAQRGNIAVAAIGQEHRLGRWWRTTSIRNGLATIRLPLNQEIPTPEVAFQFDEE